MQFHAQAGSWFWSNGSAWGACHITQKNGHWTAALQVLHGAIALKSFQLGETLQKRFENMRVVEEGEEFNIEF